MKKFIYFSDFFERSLKSAENEFNSVNELDKKHGGENFDAAKIFETLSNYAPKQNVEFGTVFEICDMSEFVKNLQDCAFSFSFYSIKNKLNNKPFAKIKIDKKDYGKKKILLEIANMIISEMVKEKLFEIVEL